MTLSIWLYHNKLTDKDLITKLPTLPPTVQRRIEHHKRLKNRLSSLAGYLLLKQALEEQQQTIDQLYFSAIGKPFIANTTLAFSISHNANLVGLCLMPEGGKVGLDIQEFRTFTPIESAFSFFSKIEQQAILASPTPNKTLIHYWSKKEALIKAGSGRMFDEAALTNTTAATCRWKGEQFYWKQVSASFDGALWVAANQALQKISTKKILCL